MARLGSAGLGSAGLGSAGLGSVLGSTVLGRDGHNLPNPPARHREPFAWPGFDRAADPGTHDIHLRLPGHMIGTLRPMEMTT
jgi:hypothetical protein